MVVGNFGLWGRRVLVLGMMEEEEEEDVVIRWIEHRQSTYNSGPRGLDCLTAGEKELSELIWLA